MVGKNRLVCDQLNCASGTGWTVRNLSCMKCYNERVDAVTAPRPLTGHSVYCLILVSQDGLSGEHGFCRQSFTKLVILL